MGPPDGAADSGFEIVLLLAWVLFMRPLIADSVLDYSCSASFSSSDWIH